MWDFADRLPVNDRSNIVSLGEGMTPLLPARMFPGRKILWKNEGANPTGSQKDRAISVAISVAHEAGFEKVLTVSTGSVGFSCAAYSARAGLPCVVLVPHGTPTERMVPMLALGAKVSLVDATFGEIETMLDRLDLTSWYEASTIQRRNNYQSEGPKTIAYEIVQQLGHAPDWLVVPVGGGGTLFGIWKGFEELHRDALIPRVPRILAVQSRRFNLLERAAKRESIFERDVQDLLPDEHEATVLRNLKHAYPPDARNAMRAMRASDGIAVSITDEDALAAQLELARREGIFCEPSAAVPVAALSRAIAEERIKSDETAVAIITGSGLREPGVLPNLKPFFVPVVTEMMLDRLIGK
jgi:threonine synthase